MRRRLSLPAAICNCLGAQGNKSRCRSSPARGGEPPKVVEGHGRGRVDAEGGKHLTCPSTMLRMIPLPQGGRIGRSRNPRRRVRRAVLVEIAVGREEHVDVRIAARSEAHTSELQSLMSITYAVLCL